MKIHLLITFVICLFCSSIFSQIKLKTYSKKIEGGFEFFADNDEYCPVSVKVDFTLNNMKSSNGNHETFVIPARSKGVLISKITFIKRARYGFSSKTNYNYGNHLVAKHNDEYVYNLPFAKDEKFKVSQGYLGKRTHKNENALDFSMPIGTNIYAAREGKVVRVVDTNVKTCNKIECAKYNNSILVYHKDGTFSSYVHIDTNSAKVKVGDTIAKGQLIAESGNIGWSSGPHLHFVVFNQQLKERKTVKTKFKVDDGKTVTFLKEKEKYKRTYN